MTTATEKKNSVSNVTVAATYKKMANDGANWDAISAALGMESNAAQARIQSLKNDLRSALEGMKGPSGQPFTVNEIDAMVDKAYPPIKRVGGGRKSDKKSVTDAAVAELMAGLKPKTEETEETEAPSIEIA